MSNNTSTYIVDFCQWNASDQIYKKVDDCILSLDDSNGTMVVRGEKNNVMYFTANIKENNVVILSRKKNNYASMYNGDFTIDYELYYDGKKYAFRFDSRSSSSEKNFYELFNKIRYKVQSVELYPSGNKKIEGTRTKTGYNGLCVEYYDDSKLSVKYIGEFEDNMYDGEGEFISKCGNIRLICRNICSNVPNGKGKLIIGRNKIIKFIDMKKCKYDSTSDCYTNNIYKDIEPQYRQMMERMQFESYNNEEKLIYLFEQLQLINDKLGEINKSSEKSLFNLF